MKNIKNIIAPLIITAILIAYVIVYFALLIFLIDNIVFNLLLGLISIAFSAIMIYVCIERIKEIKSGEEDDISKY